MNDDRQIKSFHPIGSAKDQLVARLKKKMKEKKKKNEAHQKGKTNGPQGETKKKRTDPPALDRKSVV